MQSELDLGEEPRKGGRIALREAENGTVSVEFWATRVWIWPRACEIPLGVWLLMSRRANGEMKYSLCKAPKETAHAQLATRQGQRHFVERVFEDAKSELGMRKYQVREWRAWHHHMALVGMGGYLLIIYGRIRFGVFASLEPYS